MNFDRTQPQSFGDVQRSEQLSLQMTESPTIPGYRIQRPVGEGAYGQVWLATDLNTGRPVAIKCYLNRANLNLAALEREVGLLVNMSTGRHIVQVLKVGWEHDPPYFVMEYLENGSLEELIRKKQMPSVSKCVEFLTEIARGLEFAHSKGVIHCDLKPANVLLDHSLQPRIADFGQGRMAGDQTPSLGTLFYMAPEQALNNSVPDVKWDVYSLGAMAYTLLVGSPPYRSQEVTDSLQSATSLADRLQRYRDGILQSPLPNLHNRRLGVDRTLAAIIDRCLHRDANQRFQNVQQVIGALESRARNRGRRPLYILGIAGPILLLILMLMFSARSLVVAVSQSEESVVQRALESNRFAARYAARTLQSELQTLFSIVEEEARSEALSEHLQRAVEAGKEPLDQLSDGKGSAALAASIRGIPERQPLEQFLQDRLNRLLKSRSSTQRLLNSVFINDARGNNLAIAFSNEAERNSAVSPVGQNFAYRSYFNGLHIEGKPSDSPSQFSPTRTTTLSSSFRSTSTGAWKIAVSTPVFASEPTETEAVDRHPIGVLVMTINLGDFELLAQQVEDNVPQRFAALFDGRPGNQQGMILQHPFIRRMDREKMKSLMMPQLKLPVMEALVENGLADYEDPVAQLEGCDDYAGQWIACVAQVELPQVSSDSEREKSDLWILVQEPRAMVAAPIQSLAKKLWSETMVEFLVLFAVVGSLWYFVLRWRGVQDAHGHISVKGTDDFATTLADGR